MSDMAIEKAMANAEASINMEGLAISTTCKALCKKLLNQEISFEEFLKLIVPESAEQ